MPSTAPATIHYAKAALTAVGEQLRTRRKALKVSATTAAEAADISRVTLHRIEKGEPSVTMGAYLNVMTALGLNLGIQAANAMPGDNPANAASGHNTRKGWVPARITLANYPQLQQLAWHVQGLKELTPAEALSIYERNARHLDLQAMEPHERDLMDALRVAYGTTAV